MRIRSVKPEFFKDRVTGRLSPELKILFIGLWCFADDEGRFEWEPELIRAELFPYEPGLDIDGGLETLRSVGRVVLYEVGGVRYGHIPSFDRHQHPDKPRKSILPEPSPTPPRALPDASPQSHSGIGGDRKGEERRGLDTSAATETTLAGFIAASWPTVEDAPTLVAKWIAAYPRVDLTLEAKAAAAWCESNPKKATKLKDCARFLNGWFAREEKKLRALQANQQPQSVPLSTAPPPPELPAEMVTEAFELALQRGRSDGVAREVADEVARSWGSASANVAALLERAVLARLEAS